MNAEPQHVAVMAREALEYLAPRAGGTYVDCTLGAGGHSRLIAHAMGSGRLIGIDKDPEALAIATAALAPPAIPEAVRFEPVHADFADTRRELLARGIERADGAIADFGMSSMQVNRPERGFSFAADGPLDMRMNPEQELTAEQVVNEVDERELADLIFQFGDERRSRRIARAIVRSRPHHTTAHLAGVVAAANRPMKSEGRGARIHPATRTFQALRIYVNGEIDAIGQWLEDLPKWLAPGARAVAISFHSLEDRPVKQSFRAGAQQGLYRILTPHTVRPDAEETRENPRARSARLRAVERAADTIEPAEGAGRGERHGRGFHATNR